MVDKEALTRPITISTGLPSPPRQHDLKFAPQVSDPTIEIRACSELIDYAAAVKYFNSGSRLHTLQDFDGSPVLFAVGQNDLLNCLIHHPGKAGGWSMYTLHPSADRVVAFDVFKHDDPDNAEKSGFFVTAATAGNDGITTIYHSWKTRGPATDWKVLTWKKIANSGGQKSIASLMVGLAPPTSGMAGRHIIFAGSKAQGEKAATFYIVNPTDELTDPWIPYAADTAEDVILDLQPATLGTAVQGGQGTDTQNGLFVLSQKVDRTDVLFYALHPTTLQKSNSMSILRPKVGKVKSVFSSRNPWGYTDLALACEKGVCFVNYRTPTEDAVLVEGLPETEFAQVVCSELISPTQDATVITMFAVTRSGDLYFVEGRRTWGDAWTLTLRSSGLPIRKNITNISCQYNFNLNSSELIYASTKGSEIKHLLRDPVTKCWSEDVIRFAAPRSIKSYHAFMTTISIRSTDGSVLSSFPVGISAGSALVLVNECSYALSAQSTLVPTNDKGQIILIAPAMDSLLAPSYTLDIASGALKFSATVHGGQRVSNILSSVRGSDGVSGAKTSTGASVFSPADIEGRENDFEESAEFLKDFPTLYKSVDVNSDTSSQALPDKEMKISHASTGETVMIAATMSSFWTDLTDFLGDVLEWIKDAAKAAFKAVCKVIATGVKFFLKIAGKLISFVVRTVGPLLKAIGTFLKEKLGIDFGKLFRWLGLTFDVEKTKANQKVMKDGIHTLLSLPGHFFAANAANLDKMFTTLERELKPIIGDVSKTNVGTVRDPNAELRDSPLGWLIDNPIIDIIMKFNPMSFILEAVSDSVGDILDDEFRMPDFGKFAARIGETLSNVISDEFEIVLGLFAKLWERVKTVANDPAKTLETLKGAFQDIAGDLFRALRTAVTGIWQVLGDLMDLVVEFIEGEWTIPFITDFFNWYAEQEFTVLNVFTFVLARIVGLIVGDDNVAQILSFKEGDQSLVNAAKNSNIFAFHPQVSGTTVSHLQGSHSEFRPSMATVSHRMVASADDQRPLLEENEKPRKELKVLSASSQLSRDAKDRIHDFEAQSSGATALMSLWRCGLVAIEAIQAARNADNPGRTPTSLTMPLLAVVGGGLNLSTSIAQICFYETALSYSDEVREHLSAHDVSRKVGHCVSLVANCSALGFSGYNFHLAKTKKGALPGIEFAVGILATTGSFADIIAVHLVPEWDKLNSMGKIGDIMELIASTCGLITVSAAHFPGDGEIVGMVTGASDFFLTLVSVILGLKNLTTSSKDED